MLSSLSGTAHIAIVSEGVLRGSGEHSLPLPKMLEELSQGSSDPKDIARRMIVDAQGNAVETLAAVDLDQFPKVAEGLQSLRLDLMTELLSGKAEQVRAAVENTPVYEEALQNNVAVGKIRDLGSLLHNLTGAEFSPALRATEDRHGAATEPLKQVAQGQPPKRPGWL